MRVPGGVGRPSRPAPASPRPAATSARSCLRTLSGNATFRPPSCAARPRRTGRPCRGCDPRRPTKTFAAWSKNNVSPQVIRPASGRWNPAIDISVVVLPHPLGPRRVRNSLSRTVKLTSLSARSLAEGLGQALHGDLRHSASLTRVAKQPPADGDCQDRDRDLDHGQRRDRTVGALLSGLQHGHAHDLVARGDQEQGRVVVVEDRDEHQG